MDKRNVQNILNALAVQSNIILTAMHDAQREACSNMAADETIELILRYQRIADKINKAFEADMRRLDQLLSDW